MNEKPKWDFDMGPSPARDKDLSGPSDPDSTLHATVKTLRERNGQLAGILENLPEEKRKKLDYRLNVNNQDLGIFSRLNDESEMVQATDILARFTTATDPVDEQRILKELDSII